MFKLLINEIRAWLETLIGSMPGHIGSFLRYSWFRRRFKRGYKVSVDRGCEFLSPQTMCFEGSVSIGKNSFFSAEGGTIFVDSMTSFNMNVHINASVGGKIEIGKSCLIGPNVVMRTAGHKYDDPNTDIRQQGHIPLNISIGDDVWIGSNAIILGGVHIAKGAVIGAGAVVTKDIPSLAIAVGVPARVIGFRSQETTEND